MMDVDPRIRGRLICQYMLFNIMRFTARADLVNSVSNITDDATTFTTSLAAQAVPWSEVAHSYDLTFGQAAPVFQDQLVKRGVHTHEFKSVNFNVGAGQQGQRFNIYTDPK